jgi:hypothetical protein
LTNLEKKIIKEAQKKRKLADQVLRMTDIQNQFPNQSLQERATNFF